MNDTTGWREVPSSAAGAVRADTPAGEADEMDAGAWRAKLDARKFDYANPPPPPVHILLLNSKVISTPGNITNIQAPPKAGKTSTVGGVLAAVIAGDRPDVDTLGFASSNPQGKAVLHFDTEQSRSDHDTNVRLALTRAQHEGAPPDWLESYFLTDLDGSDRLQHVLNAMDLAAAKPGGLLLVIIDGVADLCGDPNNAGEAFALVDKLQQAAITHNCAIVTVLHENPGSDIGKMRGHLGSQIERKAETALRLAKDTASGIITIWAERARHCMIPRDAGQCIGWCDKSHRFVSCGTARDIKAGAKQAQAQREVSDAFGGGGALGYGALCVRIVETVAVGTEAAKKRVAAWTRLGLIRKDENGHYTPCERDTP